jgi:hypothetical protein
MTRLHNRMSRQHGGMSRLHSGMSLLYGGMSLLYGGMSRLHGGMSLPETPEPEPQRGSATQLGVGAEGATPSRQQLRKS